MAGRGAAQSQQDRTRATDEAPGEPQLVVDEFLVEITRFGRTRRVIWDAQHALPLDHPATYELERTGDRFAVRAIESGELIERINLGATRDDSADEPTSWIEDIGIGISVRRMTRPNAAFMPQAEDARKLSMRGLAPEIYALAGAEHSVLDFVPLKGGYVGRVGGTKVFSIKKSGLGYNVTSHSSELVLEIPGRTPSRVSGSTQLEESHAANCVLRVGDNWWRFNLVGKPMASTLANMAVPEIDLESIQFNSLARKVLIAMTALSFALWLHPVPKEVVTKFKEPEKKIEIIELVKPKVIVELKPKPKETPKPKPTPKPPEKPKPKPKPPEKPKPKPPEKPKPKPKKPEKPTPKPPKPVKPMPKPPAPKQSAPKHAPQPAKVDKISPKVTQARATAPVPPPPKPGPTAEQIKAAQTKAAQANLAKSLGFLSAPSSKFAKAAPVFSGEPDPNAKYSKIGAGAAAAVKGSRTVLGGASGGAFSSGPISTRNSRNVNSDTGLSGSYGSGGKGLNDVQGKVALNQLYDPNGADVDGALGGGSGMQMSGAGSISESAILKVLQKYQERFNYCYEKALLSHPTIAGNLVMQWAINPGGRSSDVKVARSGLNDTGLHNCMIKELGKITFPSPSGGPVTVKFPFAFSSSTL